MNNTEEYETLANFTFENCSYIIRQPKEAAAPEELERFYTALGKLVYRKALEL